MRWQRGPRSRNLEDRRSQRPRRAGLGGGRLSLPRGRGGKLSFTGILVVLGVSWLLGINPLTLLGGLSAGGPTQVGIDPGISLGGSQSSGGASESLRTTPAEEELVDFVSFVVDDVQLTWAKLLPGYRDAKIVLFRGATRSGCGVGRSEMGPFYCPRDQKVYVDLGFFEDLRARFGAPGDFAQAYVLGHEIGHHIQTLTGVSEQVRREQGADRGAANEISVRMELQADCFAGVWGTRHRSPRHPRAR
jgi:predicted metalloprotease